MWCDTVLVAAVLTQAMVKGPHCKGEPSTSAQYRSHFFCGEKQDVFGYSAPAHPPHLLSHFAGQKLCWEEAWLLLQPPLPWSHRCCFFPSKEASYTTGNGLRICGWRLRKHLESNRNLLLLRGFITDCISPPCPGTITAEAVSDTLLTFPISNSIQAMTTICGKKIHQKSLKPCFLSRQQNPTHHLRVLSSSKEVLWAALPRDLGNQT